jgi:hypothetical protein
VAKEGSVSKLDELFDAYDKRKQSEHRMAAERAAREKRECEAARSTLRERVLPTLNRLAEQIRRKGHDARVMDQLDTEHPALLFDFTPAISDPPPIMSRVSFAWTGGESMETVQQIARSASRGIAEKWRVRDATDDWTSKQVLAMVEAALRNH